MGQVSKWHTAAEVAQALGSSTRTVNRWATLRSLGQKVGVQRLFTNADIRELRKLVQPSRGNPQMGKDQPAEWAGPGRKKISE